MNQNLQIILDFIETATHLSNEDKTALTKAAKEADKTLTISEFKLERTEKVKRTTAILLEETIEELEQKRDAIKKRTVELEYKNKELEIERSLEKVRAQAMGMKKPEDLPNVCEILYKELKTLGFDNIRNAMINIHDDEKRTFNNYDYSDEIGKSITPLFYDIHPVIKKQIKKIRSADDAFSETVFKGKDLESWNAFRKSQGEKDDKRITNCKALYYYFYSIGIGSVGISTFNSIPKEKQDVLKRFRNVFAFAYRRYMDVAQAEEQAREAEIELALERVRAKTMAMQHSDELQDAAFLMFQQIEILGVSAFGCGFNIWDDDRKASTAWMAGENRIQPPFKTSSYEDIFVRVHAASKKEDSLYVEVQSGKALKAHYKYMLSISVFKGIVNKMTEKGLSLPSFQIMHCAFFSKGYLMFISFEPVPDAHDIFKRFATVFEQTYTRFLDLQKAEHQAREAKIETSLERMRNVAMNIRTTEEVLLVAESMYKELKLLDFNNIRNAQIVINLKDNETYLVCIHSDDTSEIIRESRYDTSPIIQQLYDELDASKDAFYQKELKGTEFDNWLNWRKSITETIDERILEAKSISFYLFSIGEGHLGISAFNTISEEKVEVLQRFRNVFEMTYRRFIDLQKSEAQAREAQIELALERVRARTMAMQTSDELAETAVVLFKQLIDLGIEPNRLYIGIIQEENQHIEMWATDEDGSKIGSKVIFDSKKNSSVAKIFNGWKKQVKSLNFVMEGNELSTYLKYLNEELGISVAKAGFQKKRFQSIGYFSKGLIGIAAPEEQPQETIKLLERFAGVFNLTYTRFKDLKVAEAQFKKAEEDLINLKLSKKRAEDALTELQHTQKQLIQSEKMASLGELTAGIAHEIQNPLNFVNNFSEVSNELIDEMNEEIEKGDLEEAKFIMADIKSNLEKISHHGRRAEAIVKGMLQHSRTSSAEKEPTDINKLADEYFRLAYHGLRAKDRTFNATLETDYDDSIGKISVIPQDIGRVILNLITNAFYVVDESKKSGIDNYVPTVKISTKMLEDKITISVKDNGYGIPKHILDKIFQPFFTTKPTGQGTGLGLSMSYDIVTKGHGGELTVATKEGAGTTFTITLPNHRL